MVAGLQTVIGPGGDTKHALEAKSMHSLLHWGSITKRQKILNDLVTHMLLAPLFELH